MESNCATAQFNRKGDKSDENFTDSTLCLLLYTNLKLLLVANVQFFNA